MRGWAYRPIAGIGGTEVALWSARGCMAEDVKGGKLDLRYRIDVHDESGELVHRLAFADALQIVAA